MLAGFNGPKKEMGTQKQFNDTDHLWVTVFDNRKSTYLFSVGTLTGLIFANQKTPALFHKKTSFSMLKLVFFLQNQ